MHRKLFALVLLFIVLCSVTLTGSATLPSWLRASDATLPLSEIKAYCNATLEDDFADDRVIVVLNNAASTALRTFTNADFDGIGCVEVESLNPFTTQRVNAVLTGKTEETQKAAEPNVVTFAEFQEVDTASFRQILCLTLEKPGKQNVLDAIDVLMKHPDVLSAEPDYVLRTSAAQPNDPAYSEQWALDKIQVRDAWDYSTGNATVRVGIIDSGIDGAHPELRSKINVSLSRNFPIIDDPTPDIIDEIIDVTGHGTHVAGIIGAATNNGQGISGTCYNVELVSLRVMQTPDEVDENSQSNVSFFYKAIDHAKNNNIPILNMSLVWVSSTSHTAATSAFATSLAQYGGLLVCAAGNQDNNPNNNAVDIDNSSQITVYPASFESEKILVVGASTANDTHLAGTNWGVQSVDLFAPGNNILSCYPQWFCNNYCDETSENGHHSQGYHYCGGTSMAAPYVTGVAALILAKYPSLSATQIKARIMESVDSIPALSGKCVTGGRLNAYKAVHPHSIVCTATALKHTYGCACGFVQSTANHTFVTNSPSGYICSVCGYTTMILPYAHEYESELK